MHIKDLGKIEFDEAYGIQKETVQGRIDKIFVDTLYLAEHEPVVTLGRLAKPNSVLDENALTRNSIRILNTDRGGQATYHGPGQLVLYPIIDMEIFGKDLRRYLTFLERFALRFLLKYNMNGMRKDGNRGVWVNGKKICSIGIGVRRWVSYHGVSINIDMDLKPFSYIKVCGEQHAEVTSVAAETGEPADFRIAKVFAKYSFLECYEDLKYE